MPSQKIKHITKACQITTEILHECIANIRTFKTEKAVDRWLRGQTRKRGCTLAFPPIVAVGRNAAEIHHKPNNTKLRKGFLVLDFGVKYKGYCSDMTRTLYVGTPSQQEQRVYDKVLKAAQAGIRKIKAGASCFEIDYASRKVLHEQREFFIHALGHGVGEKIHEKPSLSPRGIETLKPGHVVTIEPGVYVKGKFGIRIEDTLLVTRKGYKVLTRLPKKLYIIK